MIFLIDKLVIGFLYANILANRLSVASITVSKLLAMSAIILSFVYVITERTALRGSTIAYIAGVMVVTMLMAAVSIIAGNNFEHVMQFVSPNMFVMMVPALIITIGTYGPERYIRHLVISSLILAVFIVSIAILVGPLEMKELAVLSSENPEWLISISFPDGAVKVNMVTGGFLPAALLMLLVGSESGFGKIMRVTAIGIILCALYLSKTISLWGGMVASLVLFGLLQTTRIKPSWIIASMLFVIVALVGMTRITGDLLASKQESFYQKGAQTEAALEIFAENPLFGRGLGYYYQQSLMPGLSMPESPVLESSYGMILSSTGLLGVAAYAFIYLAPVVIFLLIAERSRIGCLFVAAHIGIMVAAVGNPYIWSGGLGLLFSTFLVALSDVRLPAAEQDPARNGY